MIGKPLGQMWLWTSMATSLLEQDPSYFDDFWTKPGYVGFDQPGLVEHQRALAADPAASFGHRLQGRRSHLSTNHPRVDQKVQPRNIDDEQDGE